MKNNDLIMLFESQDTATGDMNRGILSRVLEAACQRVRMHGKAENERKAVEEMAELTAALSHVKDGKVSENDVACEIADVIFTAVQLSQHYGVVNVVNHLCVAITKTNVLYKNMEVDDGKEN